MNDKKLKRAVALVIYDSDHKNYLTVQRPLDDESLPGSWGFPAASVKEGETYEEVIERIGKTKLGGITFNIGKILGEQKSERAEYFLELRDYEVTINSGELNILGDDNSVTQYIDMKWTTDPSGLIESAQKGSVCCRVFLDSEGISWE